MAGTGNKLAEAEALGSTFPDISHPKKRAMLAAYAECGNVTQAAEAVGISRRIHYEWLATDEAYAAAVDQAYQQAADRLEQEARRRAIEGVDEPVYQRGERVGTIRRYSDTLLIFLLKGARPEKYSERHVHTGADGGPIRLSLDLAAGAGAEAAGGSQGPVVDVEPSGALPGGPVSPQA